MSLRSQSDILVRRAIALSTRGPGRAVGWLEDNFHHFGVTVTHDGEHVQAVSAATLRIPWTTCREAGQPLTAVIGQPLIRRASRLAQMLPMQYQCTHLFELTALAMAHAATGRPDRRYDAVISTEAVASSGMAGTLWQDGSAVMTWTVDGGRIIQPPEHQGQPLIEGFRDWLELRDDEEAEYAWILRRAFWLAAGRKAFQPKAIANEMGVGHVCHTFQPEQRNRAYAIDNVRNDICDAHTELLVGKNEIP